MTSYEIVNTIVDQDNPDKRYVVTYDNDATDPRTAEWSDMGVKYVEIKPNGWGGVKFCGNDGDALEIASTMEWAYGYDGLVGGGADEIAAAIVKHYKRAGLDVYDGNVWNDWIGHNIVSRYIVADSYDAADAVGMYETWVDGNVFMVTTQTRHVWHDAAGEEMVTWDDVDTIGGIYGLDYDDAEEVASYAA